jgi:hypothetical protein
MATTLSLDPRAQAKLQPHPAPRSPINVTSIVLSINTVR